MYHPLLRESTQTYIHTASWYRLSRCPPGCIREFALFIGGMTLWPIVLHNAHIFMCIHQIKCCNYSWTFGFIFQLVLINLQIIPGQTIRLNLLNCTWSKHTMLLRPIFDFSEVQISATWMIFLQTRKLIILAKDCKHIRRNPSGRTQIKPIKSRKCEVILSLILTGIPVMWWELWKRVTHRIWFPPH